MGIRPFKTRILAPRPFSQRITGVRGRSTMRKGLPALRSQRRRPATAATKPSQVEAPFFRRFDDNPPLDTAAMAFLDDVPRAGQRAREV